MRLCALVLRAGDKCRCLMMELPGRHSHVPLCLMTEWASAVIVNQEVPL